MAPLLISPVKASPIPLPWKPPSPWPSRCWKEKMPKRLIIGLSGSSAPILGIRLLEVLQQQGEIETHLILSPTLAKTLAYEAIGWSIDRVKGLASFCHEADNIA